MEKFSLRSTAITAAIALIFGFCGAALWSLSGLGNGPTKEYLLNNPEILPQMAENYEKSQTRERLAGAGGEVSQPFPGAVLGNPKGTVTLVKFTDYACSFCNMSRPHVDSLIAANPDLRVVVREWPIFKGSGNAAKMALAAAHQGKFSAFHSAMFEQGSPTEGAILAAAGIAGLDLTKAQTFINSPEVQFELTKNAGLAQQLGFGGTPSWVVGEQALEGAVGPEKLQQAIDAAREL